MKILSKRQILLLHDALIRETGGSPGLRDEGMLEYALTAPFQGCGSFTPYPTVQQKAARLGFGLVMDHPFVDGNKRIGAHADPAGAERDRTDLFAGRIDGNRSGSRSREDRI